MPSIGWVRRFACQSPRSPDGLPRAGAPFELSPRLLWHAAQVRSGDSVEMNERQESGEHEHSGIDRLWVCSDFSPFGQFQSVLHVNAEIKHRAVGFGMTEENLNGA